MDRRGFEFECHTRSKKDFVRTKVSIRRREAYFEDRPETEVVNMLLESIRIVIEVVQHRTDAQPFVRETNRW
jgi:hypothetical protein